MRPSGLLPNRPRTRSSRPSRCRRRRPAGWSGCATGLSGSQSALGRGLLALLVARHHRRRGVGRGRGHPADRRCRRGVDPRDRHRPPSASGSACSAPVRQEEVRELLRAELLDAVGADADRTLHTAPSADRPAVVLVVGVNGTGKTTTCGKLARVLVGDGHTVLLGAADTFRAAAADQLATWGARVGAIVVRGPEGSDAASVAFDAVHDGTERHVDTVVIDTAGRLHTKSGLMDLSLTKVKRVVSSRQGPIDEVLLVLDATTGQNGLAQGPGLRGRRRRHRHRADQGPGRHPPRAASGHRGAGESLGVPVKAHHRARRRPGRSRAVRAGSLRRGAARRRRVTRLKHAVILTKPHRTDRATRARFARLRPTRRLRSHTRWEHLSCSSM